MAGLPMMIPVAGSTPKSKEFVKNLKEAYIDVGHYLQHKMPLDNDLLRRLASLDPKVQGHSTTALRMKRLPLHFPTVLKAEETSEYEREVNNLHVDDHLPDVQFEGKDVRVDVWWDSVFKQAKGRYQHLEKIVKAALSIFTSPHVEASFSVMNNLITSTTNRLDVSTYSSYQRVKYDLRKTKTTTAIKYRRENKLYSKVDRTLCFHMQTSHVRHKKKIDAKQQTQLKKKPKLPSIHAVADKTKLAISKKRKAHAPLPPSHPPKKTHV